jgi:glyoxylase I family protein
MIIEHVAIQHPQPVAAADWYCVNLGMRIARASDGEAKARFVADSDGRTVLEIYNNPAAPVPDYPTQSPLTLHIAFLSADLAADTARLVAAGATVVQEAAATPDGDVLAMLRDPWGVPLQLVQRKTPL